MSQAGRLGIAGAVVSSVVGGQYKDVVPVMDAVTSGTTVTIYNNTWNTPYVVDKRVTEGEKGTYSTIQSAIDAAVANTDAGSNVIAHIQIRGYGSSDYYLENLSFPDASSIYLEGVGSALTPNFSVLKVAVVGNHTMTGTCTLSASNIYFAPSGGFAFSPAVNQTCNFSECSLNFSVNGGIVNLFNCTPTGNSECLDTPGCTAYYCAFNTLTIHNTSIVTCYDTHITSLAFTTESSNTNLFIRCTIVNSSGTTSSSVPLIPRFFDCQFGNPINVTGGVFFAGNTKLPDSALEKFYNSTVVPYMAPSQAGNVRIVRKVNASYQVLEQDDYIGVTDTSAARTITLPLSTALVQNQQFDIKDESGGAATNNITISGNGANIDGAATTAINVNYGSAKILWDGTSFWTI